MVRGKGNVPPRIPRVRSALGSTQVEEFGVAAGGGVWVAAGGKVGHTYKYYLTRLGRRLVLTALKLKEALIIPTLARASV